MQSVGEVMAIGRTFRESLQKAYRSLEVGLNGFEPKETEYRDLDMSKIRFASAFRLLKVKQAFEQGNSFQDIAIQTQIDPWFLYQIQKIIAVETECAQLKSETEFAVYLKKLKRNGFSDCQIARMWDKTENKIRQLRKKHNILPTYKVVDTCAAEFVALTPYCYSTYETENEIGSQGNKFCCTGIYNFISW
jgi:carbamoyl-phosphate synthase large subunit